MCWWDLFCNTEEKNQPQWNRAGAPQKIMYIAEETFKKEGVQANIQYHTALPGTQYPLKFGQLTHQYPIQIIRQCFAFDPCLCSQFCLVWRSMQMHFGRWLRAGNVTWYNFLKQERVNTKMVQEYFISNLTQGHQCEPEAQSDWGEARNKGGSFPAPWHTRDGLYQNKPIAAYLSTSRWQCPMTCCM